MLNHGAFGACPKVVLDAQNRLRAQMESDPVRFFLRQMEPILDRSRQALAGLVGSEAADLVFVRNATAGVNSVLRSLRWKPGDELLLTNHAYNACRNAADYVADRSRAKVSVVAVPMPIDSPRQVIDAVMAGVTDRTRLVMLDHVTSPTALVFPIVELLALLAARGVDVLVDGAHAPGMVPLNLAQLGAAYYAGNCHKWLSAPKGAGFLYVRPDRQEGILPVVISHGLNTRRPGRSLLHDAFDWTGTDDLTPWLCVAEAIRFLESTEGGVTGLIERNHALALAGRELLCRALRIAPPCPEEMIGSMAAVPLPVDPDPAALDPAVTPSPVWRLQTRLLERFGIEVPVYYWPTAPHRLVRISAQAYNDLGQYERLAEAMAELLEVP
jgi:isopenicillin-N epimerase